MVVSNLLQRCGKWPKPYFGGGCLILLLMVAPVLQAQVEVQLDGTFIFSTDDEDNPADDSSLGISPAPADGRFLAYSEKLDRYLRHEKWPEAFAVLNAFDELPDEGFAKWQGVYRPWRQAVLLRLLDLPPEGRQAYRLFNDPRAAAEAAAVDSHTDAATLNQLARKWFLTSSGPELADRAAVAAYRQGQFHQAAGWWQLLRRYHPATGPTAASRVLRQVFALKRAGTDVAASAVVATAGPLLDTPVTVADKTMPLREALPELAAKPEAELPADVTIEPAPLWHHAFFDRDYIDSQEQLSNHNLQRAMVAIDHSVPTAAVADSSIILNWRHALSGLDLKTGRLQWRDIRLSRVFDPQQTYRIIQYHPAPPATLVGDRILAAVRRDQKRSHGRYSLFQIDAKTGKTVWSAEKIRELRNFRVITDWLVTANGDAICAGYQQSSNIVLSLVRIPANGLRGDAQNLKPIVETIAPLKIPGNMRHVLNGKLTQVGGQFYLALSSGQLASIDAAKLELLWVTDTADVRGQPQVSSYHYRYGYQPVATTDLLTHRSRIIVKQPNSARISAVNAVDGTLVWHRPCLPDSQLIARAGEHFILAADGGLSALSSDDGKLVWHAPMPADVLAAQPIITRSQILVLTHRGIVILDRLSGSRLGLIRGHDVGASAASLILHDNHLLALTAAGITAYEVSPANGVAP